MAWTSKDLRKIILSRSSASVWRRSLSTVEDLPKCLVGMNEPQYAHLMFDETCHVGKSLLHPKGMFNEAILDAVMRCRECEACNFTRPAAVLQHMCPQEVRQLLHSMLLYHRFDLCQIYTFSEPTIWHCPPNFFDYALHRDRLGHEFVLSA